MARDKTQGVIRKLRAREAHLFQDHLLRLDAESRNQRFLGGVNDAFISRYPGRCFANGATVFAYIEDGKVLGAAELHPEDQDQPNTAEIAFSVEPELRRRGIGQRLFRRLITSARNEGIRHLRLNSHPSNEAMQALARKFKAQITFGNCGTMGSLKLPQATHSSIANELLDDIEANIIENAA
ncbi:mycothiol acetyltransferase [Variibacter gotjawalensis]|uniref:Mycothiol acetyltransferase n=1 Tax=Variibacter gotjawalensis TaxID=1333996 RepID=A0A0S3PZJ2_9BRAD|nr:GNAT family N-acetyltransferase [Variibacter gotjawalensis]NIK47199.1 RimJ/RimL family protein N-acetyltransferase [Variibacter gotjawalensis]RZS49099.1 acetyltransferase (GNAT) family protein [Variibacter gotjawalensis]BAT61361.1 mycothiol acetyltransferase [Variibacter gotjawalensis]